jgi:Flp pilus assembly pilin Flp
MYSQEAIVSRADARTMQDEAGQALVEYVLVLSLVALVCVASLTAVGVNVVNDLTFPPGL